MLLSIQAAFGQSHALRTSNAPSPGPNDNDFASLLKIEVGKPSTGISTPIGTPTPVPPAIETPVGLGNTTPPQLSGISTMLGSFAGHASMLADLMQIESFGEIEPTGAENTPPGEGPGGLAGQDVDSA